MKRGKRNQTSNNFFDFSDKDEYVCKNVATLIREISKHTPEVYTTEPIQFDFFNASIKFTLTPNIILMYNQYMNH